MNFSMAKNKIVMALVIATGGLVVVGNGCSRFLSSDSSAENNEGSYHGDTISDPAANPGDIHVILGAPTASTIYAKAALRMKESQLGVNASVRTIGVYENQRGMLPGSGAVAQFSAPMAMAVTTIGSDLCKDVIDQQASLAVNQRFFKDFDMSAAGKPTRAALEFSIRALSLSLWDRQPDNTELQELITLIDDSIVVNEVNGHLKSALLICGAMNSTTDAILR